MVVRRRLGYVVLYAVSRIEDDAMAAVRRKDTTFLGISDPVSMIMMIAATDIVWEDVEDLVDRAT